MMLQSVMDGLRSQVVADSSFHRKTIAPAPSIWFGFDGHGRFARDSLRDPESRSLLVSETVKLSSIELVTRLEVVE